MIDERDIMAMGLVFSMIDDGGIGNNVFEFSQDEGFDSAISKVETWRDSIEDMLEATNDPNHYMTKILLEIRKKLSFYLENLVIQSKLK